MKQKGLKEGRENILGRNLVKKIRTGPGNRQRGRISKGYCLQCLNLRKEGRKKQRSDTPSKQRRVSQRKLETTWPIELGPTPPHQRWEVVTQKCEGKKKADLSMTCGEKIGRKKKKKQSMRKIKGSSQKETLKDRTTSERGGGEGN